jgi:hypothetical protein
MAVVGSVDIGCGKVKLSVSHDPTSVSTDALKGSMIIEESTGIIYVKCDDGDTTNVKKIYDATGLVYAGKNNTALSNIENIQDNLVATTAPTSTDDSGEGYAVGSVWVDVTANKSYICVDATAAIQVLAATLALQVTPVTLVLALRAIPVTPEITQALLVTRVTAGNRATLVTVGPMAVRERLDTQGTAVPTAPQVLQVIVAIQAPVGSLAIQDIRA